MLSTLVDNSTLTAVQRLIGDVPVALSFPAEGDVSAYDQYLQALLIYDEVAAIDDYKEEFRAERHNKFSEIRFIKPLSADYEQALEFAKNATADVSFKIHRGKLGGDPIADFLHALDLHVVPAWYMQSSDWFLRLRILADESEIDLPKYGALMGAIQTQLSQNSRSKIEVDERAELETRDGDLLSLSASGDGSVADDVKAFSAGLNWIALRAAFYLNLSLRYKSAFTLHPIRHAFLAQYVFRSQAIHTEADLRKSILQFFSDNVSVTKSQSDKIIGDGMAGLKLPFFAAWAVGYAGTPRAGYDHVLQIRHSSEATNLRKRFREIEALAENSDRSDMRLAAAKLRGAISQDLEALKTRFGGSAKLPDVSVDVVSLAPSISLSPILSRLSPLMPGPNRRARTLLRNISRDIMKIPTLGDISDRFTRSRMIRKGTEFYVPKTRMESNRYANASSSFKRPI